MEQIQTEVNTKSSEFSENEKHNLEILDDFKSKLNVATAGGPEKSIEKHRKRGKLLARDRIQLLIDEGTPFLEFSPLAAHGLYGDSAPSAGIVTGIGAVHGREVVIIANDATVKGGTYFPITVKKHLRAQEVAQENRLPCVYLVDSGGAFLPMQDEVFPDRDHFGRIFYNQAQMSRMGIPQVSVVMGSCTAGGAYVPAMSDETVIVKNQGTIFLGGPPLVKAATGEDVTPEELGGAIMHSSVSGVCHVLAENDIDVINKVKQLLSFLPSNYSEKPPIIKNGDDPYRTCESLYSIIPDDPKIPYSMHEIIYEIIDNREFFEIHKDYAKSMIVGFSRFDGQPVGIIGNNPNHLAGGIDVLASEKASRFIRFCDCFNVPILFLVSAPGYIPGTAQERLGMIYRGSKLLYAVSEATVPKITVITGGAYAGAYMAMGSKYLATDFVYAWPTAEIGLIAAEGVVNTIYRKEISASKDPESERKKREKEFRDKYMNIDYPASYQHVDDVIDPKDTRIMIIRGLEVLKNKEQSLPSKKHGNMPL